jgi:hypothetical protein
VVFACASFLLCFSHEILSLTSNVTLLNRLDSQ